MSEPVYIDPATDEVRRLTAAALVASATEKPAVTIRCSRCDAMLGAACHTGRGPLFTSGWPTEPPLDYEVIYVDEDAGESRTLTRRETIRHRDRTTTVVSGGAIPDEGRDGVIALLALPPGSPEDYPALLLRCPSHGDVIADRIEALAKLRSRGPTTWKVQTSKPFTDYAYHDPGAAWLAGLGRTQHHREKRRFGRDLGGSTA